MISLAEITGEEFLFGNEQGKEVLQELLKRVGDEGGKAVIGISLKGIQATDASFPRESVISLIKMLNGEKGFYLTDFKSEDLVDNWAYAAQAKDQPVIILRSDGYQVIGPKLNKGSQDLLDFVMQEKVVTTSKVVAKFDVSAQNASAKLKKLYTMGLILGSKEVAESGGLEFVYRAIS